MVLVELSLVLVLFSDFITPIHSNTHKPTSVVMIFLNQATLLKSQLFSTKSGRGILPLTAPIPACLNIKLCSRAFFFSRYLDDKAVFRYMFKGWIVMQIPTRFCFVLQYIVYSPDPWECRHYSFSKVLWLFAYKDIWLVLFCFLLCPTLPICVTV